MSKAAKRQKAKRRRKFKDWAENDPQKFGVEWKKLVTGWLYWIGKNAGNLDLWDDHADHIPSIFTVVDEAMSILETCGQDIFRRYARETFDLLTTQCCISFSISVFPQFYRVSNGKRLCERPTSEEQDMYCPEGYHGRLTK